MQTVDIGTEFCESLTNRDGRQRDGKHTAVEFRRKYLLALDDDECWRNSDTFIVLDFANVKRIGPSWANEAFGYFAEKAEPSVILKKIKMINISRVKLEIIKTELDTAHNKTS